MVSSFQRNAGTGRRLAPCYCVDKLHWEARPPIIVMSNTGDNKETTVWRHLATCPHGEWPPSQFPIATLTVAITVPYSRHHSDPYSRHIPQTRLNHQQAAPQKVV
ncbi:hypothetical protein C0Q70_15405 [Pomacea canaliculata]|uniref:Uncharacterized protein n=1 Tax=Pomacea canaliculata TaxID=400727 RepID=A0A2T7NUT0_POMCA|nr:hypothetical protein C0Q70_15405 [Pomacea canaliculata]